MPLSKIIPILQRSGIAVIPTDTIYGIVTRACDRKAVMRLYRLRRQTARKPFIILIDHIARLREFGIHTTLVQKQFLEKVWPGKVSVVLPCKAKKFAYLHLGTGTLAFRLPHSRRLQALLKKTGPLVAPSANPEGGKPAETITEAKNYFGSRVDAYVGAGRLQGKPSTIISLLGSFPKVLRKGAVRVTLPTADRVANMKRPR